MYQGYQTYGPASFDFKAMSMQQPQPHARRKPDYFSLRPVRGSSPTASLTADLDANFHIDKRFAPHSSLALSFNAHITLCSPQAPTPRRSLFTANLFRPRENAGTCKNGNAIRIASPPSCVHPLTQQARTATPPIEIEVDLATTPTMQSSSPYCDAMDISPLPHKAPHFVAQVTLPSPGETPDETVDISPDLLCVDDVPPPLPRPVNSLAFLQFPE